MPIDDIIAYPGTVLESSFNRGNTGVVSDIVALQQNNFQLPQIIGGSGGGESISFFIN